MLIDWFTVGAQVLNFLILVWLLKRFLYKPIRDAIDARENRIATELTQADSKKAEAQKERDDFQRKNEAFDQEHAALLKKATEEAGVERHRLLDEARKDADALRAKRQDSLRNEQRNLNQEIVRWTQKEVFAIARKALADLAGKSLEDRMGEVFVQRLRTLNGAAKEQLAAALKTSSDPARVRSAFDLPSEQHAAIQHAINETFSADIHIQFETVPELISGLELSTNGQKVAWSIAEYLATLEKSAGGILQKEEKAETKAEPVASAPKADH
jgi:F-type H+-transporting ATPase subunit b